MQELTGIFWDMVGELAEILPYFLGGVLLEAWIRTKKWHIKIRKTLTRYGFAAIGVATVLGLAPEIVYKTLVVQRLRGKPLVVMVAGDA